ncbi:MAG: hypothetical protein Q9163_005561 [Psora crenata]
MPYKHIAAQLRKTELACRLHYHQLSFSSKNRRSISMSSLQSVHRSSMTPPAPLRHTPPQRRLPSFSPPASPESHDYAPDHASNSVDLHKPILPKPRNSPRRAAHGTGSLRLVTDTTRNRQYVDLARLDEIYGAHRVRFWSAIAHHYGGNLSPAALEDAWRTSQGMSASNFPPTPRGSPQSSQAQLSLLSTPHSAVTDPGKGSTAICTDGGGTASKLARPSTSSKQSSCAIASLLTEDKEIRPSLSQEQKLRGLEHVSVKATTRTVAWKEENHGGYY